MNRRIFGATALVVALAALAAADVQAQRTTPTANSTQAFWQAERSFYLTNILQRAQRQLKDMYLMVEIGTMAPVDVVVAEQAVAQIEAAIKADAVRTTTPAPWVGTRRQLAEMLDALDANEVRFQNGMVTTKNMSDAYLEIVKLLVK